MNCFRQVQLVKQTSACDITVVVPTMNPTHVLFVITVVTLLIASVQPKPSRLFVIPLSVEGEEFANQRSWRGRDGPRVTRHTWTPQTVRVNRQAHGHHHDHVEYGAHSGPKGAFGWYAEFPVYTHH